MARALRFFLHLILFLALTLATQTGGVIYLASLLLAKYIPTKFIFKRLIVFVALFLLCNSLITPVVAKYFGRIKIEQNKNLKPAHLGYVLLNRDYVHPKLNQLLQDISKNHALIYMDANFPFFDGFPLLPHLSHNDGKKIDLAFLYVDSKGRLLHKVKSRSGYGVFEQCKEGEKDQVKSCIIKGYFQYSYPEHLHFGKINSELKFSSIHTRHLLEQLSDDTRVEKIFIEPHLRDRMQLQRRKIRFHGCRAVRHDDHIHLQIN